MPKIIHSINDIIADIKSGNINIKTLNKGKVNGDIVWRGKINLLNGAVGEVNDLIEVDKILSTITLIIRERVNSYYNSYTPKIYQRTYSMLSDIETSVTKVGNNVVVSINGGFGKARTGDYLKAKLIANGWNWHKQHKPVYRYTYFEGYDFVSQAVEIFNARYAYAFNGIEVQAKIIYK